MAEIMQELQIQKDSLFYSNLKGCQKQYLFLIGQYFFFSYYKPP